MTKLTDYSATEEQQFLAAMITNDHVLGAVAAHWQRSGLFSCPSSNAVGKWCVDHYLKFAKAPGRDIRSVAEVKLKKLGDSTAKLINTFLGSLVEEYELNKRKYRSTEYWKRSCLAYFDKVSALKTGNGIKDAAEAGNMEKVDELIQKHRRLEVASNTGVWLDDRSAWESALARKKEPLMTFRGSLGKFIKDALKRESLIGFAAPEKRGKTHWLTWMAWQAHKQRLRVQFFGAGDMSQDEMIGRIACLCAKRPFYHSKVQLPKALKIVPPTPTKFERAAIIDSEEKEFDEEMTAEFAYGEYQKFLKKEAKSHGKLFRLDCRPAKSLSVEDIKRIVQERASEGWLADVIVVDYADILKPPPGFRDERDRHNAVWEGLKALSHTFDCLVFTATQTTRASYKADILLMEHMAEDKRKLAHANGILGINCNPLDEKPQGLCRLNWMAWREGEFSPYHVVHCAGNLAVGNPAIRTIAADHKKKGKDDEEKEQAD